MEIKDRFQKKRGQNVLYCTGHQTVMDDIVMASGCSLRDSDHNEYLDFESGVWCTSLGHGHPRINQVIKNQIEHIAHTGFCYVNPVIEESAQHILDVLEMVDGKCVFLCSGSEAVEFGVQVAQAISDKPMLLTMSDSYLGSYGAAHKKEENEWVLFDWLKCSSECSEYEDCDPGCPRLTEIPFEKICGFVFEPGSSSGLVRFPPVKLIENITFKIKQTGGVVMVNEVTTGIGRTGRWFGHQHYSLKPDIVALGKGLGNGYPVSVAAMARPVWESLEAKPFKYSQSHQNDPLGAAIAREVIRVIKDENLIEKCRAVGDYFLSRLRQLQENSDIIKVIRGRALMVAVEFTNSGDKSLAQEIQRRLLSAGFVVANRPGFEVIRIDPPLIVSKEQVDAFIENFRQILSGYIKQ